MADRVELTCPCCDTKLVADTATGEILAEERPKKNLEKSFDDAMSAVKGGANRREDAFSKAFNKTKNLDTLLDKKFEEAKKKAEANPDEKRHNPLDFD